MDFKTACAQIVDDFCGAYYAIYMKSQWGITVGFDTVNENIADMRNTLLEYQENTSCKGELCTTSREQALLVVSYATLETSCGLNPPLSARGENYRHGGNRRLNTNEVIINTFTR